MTESTGACHRRHFTFQVRSLDFHKLFANLACTLLAFVVRSPISPATESLDVEADARCTAFFLWDQFVSADLDLHFSGDNVTDRARMSASHCLQQNFQLSNVGLEVGLEHLYHCLKPSRQKCSHDTKMRNDRRSSTKAISFTSTSASSPERVA